MILLVTLTLNNHLVGKYLHKKANPGKHSKFGN